MVLETPRLILDLWRQEDWLALKPIATDTMVMRYINGGFPWTDEQIQSFVERQIRTHRERGFCRWKLLSKPQGDMIGFCGVGIWRDGFEPEIGWWLARAHWGQGLATEAAQCALHHAFTQTDLQKVISIARPANTASIRVMQKLGLQLECEFEHEGVQLVRYAVERGSTSLSGFG